MGTLRIGIPGIRPSAAQVEETVNKHGNMVFKLAWHLMGNNADAEDVVQTVFFKVYTHWFQLARCSNKAAWIKRVATNVCIDLMRKKKVRGPSVENATLDRVVTDDTSPTRHTENTELADVLQKALGQLPPRQLAALVLFDREGMRGSQIARILDVSETAVRSYVHEARKRLKEILTPYLRGSD